MNNELVFLLGDEENYERLVNEVGMEGGIQHPFHSRCLVRGPVQRGINLAHAAATA